jgi:hypothetical protein
MVGEIWKIYGITEDEYIEYCRCSEKLGNLGFERLDADKKLLNCSTCIFCGNCSVSRDNMFFGVKTC